MTLKAQPNLGTSLPSGTGVCVINLDSRKDRWNAICQEIVPLLEGIPVKRISATLGVNLPGYGQRPFFRDRKRDHTWAARGGCTLSHRSALLHAKAEGWSHLLILEDDITLDAIPGFGFLAALKDKLQTTHFDVCYLGYTDPVSPVRHLADVGDDYSLNQVFGCSTTHAYLVTAAAGDWILARLPEPPGIWKWLTRHRAIDRFYYRNLSPSLVVTALSPALIQQTAGFSDIIGSSVSACAENHPTEVVLEHPDPGVFASRLSKQAAIFSRASRVDYFRGLWKSIRGF